MLTTNDLRMKQPLHPWDVSPQQAVDIQRNLREKLVIAPLQQPITYLAGADVSFDRGSDIFYAGIVVFRYTDMKLCGHSLVVTRATFPYIPGLLSFRELPALLEAWQQMSIQPDVTMLDGHGVAHPRGLGIASHFGLWVNKPTLGCAKKLLVGMHGPLDQAAGSTTAVYTRHAPVGLALRTRDRIKPVYLSAGHLLNLDDARRVAQHTVRKHRLPEPTRLAHLLVNRLRRGEIPAGTHAYS